MTEKQIKAHNTLTQDITQARQRQEGGSYIAIDVENYEKGGKDSVTEIGWCVKRYGNNGVVVEDCVHVVVKENEALRNGIYVKDHKYVRSIQYNQEAY